MAEDDDPPRDYASPACLAAEIAPGYFGAMAVDEAAARDAARWRKAERQRLLAERAAIPPEARAGADAAIAAHLDAVLARDFGGAQGMVLAGFWPIRSEVDLRPWLATLSRKGVRIALPVVQARDAPLIFRPWTPEAEMRSGAWNIPEPATDQCVIPQIILAPLVGFDAQRFRMGYGGGFYDRTLAALRPRPYAIGIGTETGRLRSIYPQPHDLALDLVVTEAGAA